MVASGQRGKTILVVEDNDIQRESLAIVLRCEGYSVMLAEDGKQALERLRDGQLPDLIILDMLLPVVDGWRVLAALKADPRLSGVPIIVVTGTVLGREWAESHGCAGSLNKPIEVGPVLAEIRRCL